MDFPMQGKVKMDGWAGRYNVPLTIIGETPTRYRVIFAERTKLPRRWAEANEPVLLPKRAVSIAEVSVTTNAAAIFEAMLTCMVGDETLDRLDAAQRKPVLSDEECAAETADYHDWLEFVQDIEWSRRGA